ncbi:MAG TPA: PEGA domain-containing protein [Kofleriaceae bacterium]|nr:PEGA domain-containing protein [Kofleriaceae bacterium]
MRSLLVACLLAAACGNKPAPTRPVDESKTADAGVASSGSGSAAGPAEEKIGVALQVDPTEANVTIDDLVVGRASDLDPVFALAPGLHTLVITHPGYKTYRMEFSVTDKTESFTIHLDKK